jgi:hypothetical protein
VVIKLERSCKSVEDRGMKRIAKKGQRTVRLLLKQAS